MASMTTARLALSTGRGPRRRARVRRALPDRDRASGFTLLEVMVAVAILGITLVSIFSAEAGAIRMAGRARLLTTASLLARCKMGEIEEEIMRTGLPAVSSQGADECCEGGEVEGFDCEWEISRVVLPDDRVVDEQEARHPGHSRGGRGLAVMSKVIERPSWPPPPRPGRSAGADPNEHGPR